MEKHILLKVIRYMLLGTASLLILGACTKPPLEPAAPVKPEAAIPKQATAKTDRVILAIDEWPPFTSKSLEGYGMSAEIVTAAMEASDLVCIYQFRPWARAFEMTKHGDAWGTFPWIDQTDRRASFEYSDPINTVKYMAFYKKENPILKGKLPTYKQLQDLKAYRFGGVFGYYYESIFEKEHFTYDLSTSLQSAFEMLDSQKTDLVIEDEAVGWHTIQELYGDRTTEFETLEVPLEQKALYVLVNRTTPEAADQLKRFNEGLKIIRENGAYEGIMEKYKVAH